MSSADRKTFAETHVEYEVRMLVQEVWLLEQLDAKRRGPDDEPRLGADGQALLEAGWPETWGAKSLPPDDDVFSEIDADVSRRLRSPGGRPRGPLESTEHGLAPAGEGWFVLNAREARWVRDERSACSEFEGETEFEQIGIFLRVLSPGGTMGMYHWEADQEDFLVLSGEALLIVEGKERPLRRWDFFHCPPGTEHIIVGAGEGPCVVLAVGSREHQRGENWGAYTVDETALRHGAGVEEETTDRTEAYARAPKAEWASYQEGWLPD